MTHTVILVDALDKQWTVDLNQENVTVPFQLVDANGKVWHHGTAVFWRNIPQLLDPDGNPLPIPDEWFQIPPSHLQTLASLSSDIHSALVAKFL